MASRSCGYGLTTAAAGTGATPARLAAAALATTGARSGFAATLTSARLTALFALFVVVIFIFVLIRHFLTPSIVCS
jgi:hypothetical protein